MSLGLDLTELVLETIAVLGAISLIGRLGAVSRAQWRWITVAAAAVLIALGVLRSPGPWLNFVPGRGVGGAAGREQCLLETRARNGIPFLDWLKLRIPTHARYWLASSPDLADIPGGFDPLCVAFQMLPRLPLTTATGAGWIVYTGAPRTAVKVRIARRDPAVFQFSPGFVLVRQGVR